MQTKKHNVGMTVIFTILFYLAISDFFGLFDTSLFIPGELYEYFFILLLGFAVINRNGRLKYVKTQISLLPYYMLIAIACIQTVVLQSNGTQGLFESFSVVIELLFILTFFGYIQFSINSIKIVRCIAILDVIAVLVYAVEMMLGGPIIASIHSAGLYEQIAGLTLWRCWVDIPAFEIFTLAYLLIGIIKKQKLFATLQRDMLVFFIVFLGVVLKLGRTELFSVLICLALAYFYADRVTAGRLLKKSMRIIAIIIPLMIVMYFIANGIFMRIISGIMDIFNSFSNDESVSTFATRTSTLYVRWNYLVEQGKLLFGIGPYSYKSTIVVDPYDLYATNRYVLAPDSAYGTFLVRYGIVGTALYIWGNIKNYIVLRKEQ